MDPRSPNKRKRALSKTSTTYSTAPSSSTIINPFSHPPSTLKQFLPAGNSSDAPLPSSIYPDFPHRPLPSSPTSSRSHSRSRSTTRSRLNSFASTTYNSDSNLDFDDDHTTTAGTDAGTEGWTTDADSVSVTSTGKPITKRDPVRSTAKLHKAHQSRVGPLVAIIHRCLAEGDISLARRAFGLLVRADVNGRKVDLRFGGFWEMGAEILMRSGEDRDRDHQNLGELWGGEGTQGGTQDGTLGLGLGTLGEEEEEGMEGEDSKERRERKRLLRAAKNREQYGVEELERRPLLDPLDEGDDDDDELPLEDRFGPDADANAERMDVDAFGQQSGIVDPLRSSPPLGYQGGTDNVLPLYRSQLEEDSRHGRRPEVRLRREKDKLRLKALEQMRDVARRMDAVMENTPYNKDGEMLRLRAMVALYVGDLSVPVSVTASASASQQEEGVGNEEREEVDRWKSHEERILEEEGRRAQGAERDRARTLFLKMREMRGGELEEGDEWILEMISGGGDGDDGDGEEGDREEERGRA
ncbi:unnamed protein product [Sordaria macrospora k-hell]|uniref:WGS project CABT00000000 data, contig 2.5 n=1 Tax=Sordaria macrospora (strain ATCC MYA-333 / DSM 997 / K(L3346) / K-hell) TaxID=771870 RepID=F7VRK4_SORMK|nr:uncharacterized protein SMAC_01689 [Sordaria macrospora k-hell]CCC08139.1 unnamed protein product [Sordaria macrospora k-hell]